MIVHKINYLNLLVFIDDDIIYDCCKNQLFQILSF